MGIEFQVVDTIHRVSAEAWQALWKTDYPFVQYGFLTALEDSGCTPGNIACNGEENASGDAESGWQVAHLLGYDGEKLVLAMPMYRKTHSWGEYVFDWSWAEAYHRNGLAYYPKLVCAVPFTPATGPRIACADSHELGAVLPLALTWLRQFCEAQGFSGAHLLFPDKALSSQWQALDWQQRQGCQFHWFNRDYTSFDDFLSGFASRKRKNLRKERQQVLAADVTLQRLTGADITPQDWDAFYQFYHMTYLKRSGATGYLNRDFFARLGEAVGDQLLMVVAYREGRRIAASLCFFDNECLYGRYWGCREEVPGLHFEACYYQGIEFAIERGLQRFDPGAQGEHKIQRGFEPVLTYSNHWLVEPAFNDAVGDFLQREKPAIEQYRQQCAEALPFKQV